MLIQYTWHNTISKIPVYYRIYIKLRKDDNMSTTLTDSKPKGNRTYRVEDIAELLDIGRTSAYNLVKEGHFKTVRIGTSIRIS